MAAGLVSSARLAVSATKQLMITPAMRSPRLRAASIVSKVWFMVPRPGRETINRGKSIWAARSATVKSLAKGTNNPPMPSTMMRSLESARRL